MHNSQELTYALIGAHDVFTLVLSHLMTCSAPFLLAKSSCAFVDELATSWLWIWATLLLSVAQNTVIPRDLGEERDSAKQRHEAQSRPLVSSCLHPPILSLLSELLNEERLSTSSGSLPAAADLSRLSASASDSPIT